MIGDFLLIASDWDWTSANQCLRWHESTWNNTLPWFLITMAAEACRHKVIKSSPNIMHTEALWFVICQCWRCAGEVMVCVLDFKRDVGLWHGVLTVSWFVNHPTLEINLIIVFVTHLATYFVTFHFYSLMFVVGHVMASLCVCNMLCKIWH